MFFEMKNKNLKEDWFLTLQVPTPQNVNIQTIRRFLRTNSLSVFVFGVGT